MINSDKFHRSLKKEKFWKCTSNLEGVDLIKKDYSSVMGQANLWYSVAGRVRGRRQKLR